MNDILSQIILYISDFSKFIQKYTGNINLPDWGLPALHYSWFVVLFFAFVIFLIAITFGRSRMFLALISLYAAAFLEEHFVYFDWLRGWLKNQPEFWVHLGLFLILYVIIFTILNRSVLKHRLTIKESSVFTAGLAALMEIGFLASIVFSYLPQSVVGTLPAQLIKFFDTKTAQFWWAIVPLAVLVFLKRKKEV